MKNTRTGRFKSFDSTLSANSFSFSIILPPDFAIPNLVELVLFVTSLAFDNAAAAAADDDDVLVALLLSIEKDNDIIVFVAVTCSPIQSCGGKYR